MHDGHSSFCEISVYGLGQRFPCDAINEIRIAGAVIVGKIPSTATVNDVTAVPLAVRLSSGSRVRRPMMQI